MWLMVTLRVGVGGLSIGAGAFPHRDAMPDRDLLRSDEDVFDQQPQNPTAFVGGRGLGFAVQLGQKALQVGGQGEVGVAVGELTIQGRDLVTEVGFPGTQVGHPGCNSSMVISCSPNASIMPVMALLALTNAVFKRSVAV
jgi:hypothetical protein